MAKNIDLAKVFGVEGMITPKTLVNETREDVERKKPLDMALDIRALLDELNLRVSASDINGILDCIKASQLRLDVMNKIAEEMKSRMKK